MIQTVIGGLGGAIAAPFAAGGGAIAAGISNAAGKVGV